MIWSVKKSFILILICYLFPLLFSCGSQKIITTPPRASTATNLQKVLKHLQTPDENYVLVVAHRGDWRNAPENSILAIQGAAAMGVDIVEIDVQQTKDSVLVLMHDKTIDRTTDGKGLVSSYTLEEIKKFHLKNGLQRPTHHTIPTLEEAMMAAKGKVAVNLDKCYEYFDEALKVLHKTGTRQQAIMKGYVNYKQLKAEHGDDLNSLLFMPIINAADNQVIEITKNFITNYRPVAIEFSTLSSDSLPIIQHFKSIRNAGARVWMNSLWASQCAGYEDDKAVYNPDKIYGWYIKNGVNMIQTDRPALLLQYLRSKNLHD